MADINHGTEDTKAHNRPLFWRYVLIPLGIAFAVFLIIFFLIGETPEEPGLNWFMASFISGIFLLVGILTSLDMLFKGTCPYCKKYKAAEEIGSNLLDEHMTVRKEQFETEIKTKNRLGMTTGTATETREVLVPTKVSKYEVFKKCKYCNSEWIRNRTVEEKQA